MICFLIGSDAYSTYTQATQEIRTSLRWEERHRREEPAAAPGSSYLGPFLAQQHHDAQEACRRGIAQGGQAAFRGGIHIGPKLQEQGHHFCVTKVRLDTQNWSIIQNFCPVINVGTSQNQQSADLVIRKQTEMILT